MKTGHTGQVHMQGRDMRFKVERPKVVTYMQTGAGTSIRVWTTRSTKGDKASKVGLQGASEAPSRAAANSGWHTTTKGTAENGRARLV